MGEQVQAMNLSNFDLDKLQMTINGILVTLVGTYDSPWSSGKELCMGFGYKIIKNALCLHVKSKHKTALSDLVHLKKVVGAPHTIFFCPFPDDLSFNEGKAEYISEQGVYDLAMKCQLPIGEKFRDWLAEEVLPSIRKTGQHKLEKSFHEQLAIKDREVEKLQGKLVELREKVAVMTKNNETKNAFQVYKHLTEPNKYRFIRVQKINLYKAMRAINPEEYEIILNEVNVPNSINIPNRLKEKLVELDVSFVSFKNTLTADANVLEIVRDLIEESQT